MATDEIEGLLAEHQPSVAAIAGELRQVMRRLLPTSQERVYRGWHGIGYVHPSLGYLGAIFPRETTVRVGFERGHQLEDPTGRLLRPGKQVAYLEFTSVEEVDPQQIEFFLEQLGAG